MEVEGVSENFRVWRVDIANLMKADDIIRLNVTPLT